MKIAILTTDNRSHHQRFELEQPQIGPAPAALLEGFAELPGVEVHVITCTRRPMRSPAKLADNVWFHSLVVPKWGWMRTGYAGCLRAIRRKLREIQPDIVHGQGTELEAGLAAAFSGYPNVITLLGIMREMAQVFAARPGSFYWLAARLETLALRRTRGVLANSQFTADCVRGRTPQTWIVPNAVRKLYCDTPRLAKPAARPVVLNIGTIVDYKRPAELLDLAERLRAAGLDWEWHFVGAAALAQPYAVQFIERVKRLDWVRWDALLTPTEIIDRLDSASALVHVSRIESFGLVVAEALSRDVKFLGFASGGVRDIAAGMDGAEVFADGDWAGLEASLRQWAAAGCPRPQRAAQTVQERYYPRVVALKHLDIYRQVLQNLRPHSS